VLDIWCIAPYNKAVIKTFKGDLTQKIYQRQPTRKLPSDIQQVALRKLRMLNNAISINDLRVPPANRLERLGGDRAGQWSIRINNQWRICFEWQERDAYNVEIVDYH
jgi:proteic killer suppression protein